MATSSADLIIDSVQIRLNPKTGISMRKFPWEVLIQLLSLSAYYKARRKIEAPEPKTHSGLLNTFNYVGLNARPNVGLGMGQSVTQCVYFSKEEGGGGKISAN